MILLLGGTKEANKLIKVLTAEGYEVLVTTVSSYGGQLAKDCGAKEVLIGELNPQTLADLIKVKGIDVVVDATHPFASMVTAMAREICEKLEILYLRHTRPVSNQRLEGENLYWVNTYEEAAKLAFQLGDIVLTTTGSKNVGCFQAAKGKDQRLVVRVLPEVTSIMQCRQAGCQPKDIIAMQGPFSKELNKILYQEYGIQVVVTKDSGTAGGLTEKIAAAKELGIPAVLIRRPLESDIKNFTIEEILGILKEAKTCH